MLSMNAFLQECSSFFIRLQLYIFLSNGISHSAFHRIFLHEFHKVFVFKRGVEGTLCLHTVWFTVSKRCFDVLVAFEDERRFSQVICTRWFPQPGPPVPVGHEVLATPFQDIDEVQPFDDCVSVVIFVLKEAWILEHEGSHCKHLRRTVGAHQTHVGQHWFVHAAHELKGGGVVGLEPRNRRMEARMRRPGTRDHPTVPPAARFVARHSRRHGVGGAPRLGQRRSTGSWISFGNPIERERLKGKLPCLKGKGMPTEPIGRTGRK
mmetsp:Transcript_10869/g.67134  ORF Transcript_10869/g.67134 Transcript_10869/m.67134 type:complete len:264 (+) Transcript_10869:1522-2313(+)